MIGTPKFFTWKIFISQVYHLDFSTLDSILVRFQRDFILNFGAKMSSNFGAKIFSQNFLDFGPTLKKGHFQSNILAWWRKNADAIFWFISAKMFREKFQKRFRSSILQHLGNIWSWKPLFFWKFVMPKLIHRIKTFFNLWIDNHCLVSLFSKQIQN